jgi:RimJ/RimL family protein N-acetyltransferase
MTANEITPVAAELKGGLVVSVRALRPDDRARMAAAVRGLDSASIYTRLFSHRKELTEAGLDRLMRTDPDHEVVLLATIGGGADERIIGSARYVVTAEMPARSAEVAFVVEEDFQGRGIAGRLLQRLMDVARTRGIVRFEADVLAENASMLHVFERCGAALKKRAEGSSLHIEFDLPRA